MESSEGVAKVYKVGQSKLFLSVCIATERSATYIGDWFFGPFYSCADLLSNITVRTIKSRCYTCLVFIVITLHCRGCKITLDGDRPKTPNIIIISMIPGYCKLLRQLTATLDSVD